MARSKGRQRANKKSAPKRARAARRRGGDAGEAGQRIEQLGEARRVLLAALV